MQWSMTTSDDDDGTLLPLRIAILLYIPLNQYMIFGYLQLEINVPPKYDVDVSRIDELILCIVGRVSSSGVYRVKLFDGHVDVGCYIVRSCVQL